MDADSYRPNVVGTGGFHSGELFHLLAAWLVLSLAFTIMFTNQDWEFFPTLFVICFVTVGLGFVLHELGHKYLAQHYGFDAVFKANYPGLGMAVLIAFANFIYVAPGAVMISGRQMSKRQEGLISVIGPLINVILGVGFLSIYLNPSFDFWPVNAAAWVGFQVNIWVGLFNLIPSPSFDGSKIKNWNMPIYLALVVVTGSLFLFSWVI